MGVVRLYLAICVLQQHAPFWTGPHWVHGFAAVCSFFIISGFYMALVLDTTYASHPGRFFANRALRLAPVYWVVLALGIIGNEMGWLAQSACCNDVKNVLQPSLDMSWSNRLIAIFSNLTMFPVVLDYNFRLFQNVDWPLASMVFGQMYTVGLELLFYALAPLLVLLRGPYFVAALLASIAAHFAPHWMGLEDRPWQYEFFPTVLCFFMLGIASYRMYRWLAATSFRPQLGWIALPIFLAYCAFVAGPAPGFTNTWQHSVLYAGLALTLPFLFAASRKSDIDAVIGDLSYPVYTVQFLVIAWVRHLPITDSLTSNRVILVSTLAMAGLLYLLVERPIKPLREWMSGRVRHKPPLPHPARRDVAIRRHGAGTEGGLGHQVNSGG